MKKSSILLIITSLLLAGCHSTSKDEKYNNMSPNDIYAQGVKNVKRKNYESAIEDFEALESRYPFGEYADKAQLGAIYTYYLNEDFPSALPAVERFIRMYPRHPDVDYAYYMKGLIHFSEAVGFLSRYLPMEREDRDPTPAKKALGVFTLLAQQYPNSIYTNDAKQRIIYLRNLIAQNELVAARYYLQKGAYLAAINRASYVVTNFDGSPSLAEALSIMVEAYRELNMPDLANDAYRVLMMNYPDSPFAEEVS
ncbi:MAG: outer membrane protein assembly factor BamD [Candidatus Berkiella sp.]